MVDHCHLQPSHNFAANVIQTHIFFSSSVILQITQTLPCVFCQFSFIWLQNQQSHHDVPTTPHDDCGFGIVLKNWHETNTHSRHTHTHTPMFPSHLEKLSLSRKKILIYILGTCILYLWQIPTTLNVMSTHFEHSDSQHRTDLLLNK